VPIADVFAHIDVILNLLAGSLCGAWFGASWATRMNALLLDRVIAILLACIAAVLIVGHEQVQAAKPALQGISLWTAGGLAGFVIGVLASLLGVAGGELLIPTLVLLFGIQIKLAGSLSLAVSLPTMIVGFARYSAEASFTVLSKHRSFVFTMAAGSIAGAFVGGLLLGTVSIAWLYPILAAILLISAVKVWMHR
jgi:uncharacterized protein